MAVSLSGHSFYVSASLLARSLFASSIPDLIAFFSWIRPVNGPCCVYWVRMRGERKDASSLSLLPPLNSEQKGSEGFPITVWAKGVASVFRMYKQCRQLINACLGNSFCLLPFEPTRSVGTANQSSASLCCNFNSKRSLSSCFRVSAARRCHFYGSITTQ